MSESEKDIVVFAAVGFMYIVDAIVSFSLWLNIRKFHRIYNPSNLGRALRAKFIAYAVGGGILALLYLLSAYELLDLTDQVVSHTGRTLLRVGLIAAIFTSVFAKLMMLVEYRHALKDTELFDEDIIITTGEDL